MFYIKYIFVLSVCNELYKLLSSSVILSTLQNIPSQLSLWISLCGVLIGLGIIGKMSDSRVSAPNARSHHLEVILNILLVTVKLVCREGNNFFLCDLFLFLSLFRFKKITK